MKHCNANALVYVFSTSYSDIIYRPWKIICVSPGGAEPEKIKRAKGFDLVMNGFSFYSCNIRRKF